MRKRSVRKCFCKCCFLILCFTRKLQILRFHIPCEQKEVGNNVDEVEIRDKVQPQPGEKKERRKPRRSSTNNPAENVYKKVYNNIRRSSGDTTRKVEGKVQAKNPTKKDFLYDLICDIPGRT